MQKGCWIGRILETFSQGRPPEATRFGAGCCVVSCPAGAAGCGSSGASSSFWQRCRPLPALYCDAHGGAGRGRGCRGGAGRDAEPGAGLRGADGGAALASQTVYASPSYRLLGLLSDLPIQRFSDSAVPSFRFAAVGGKSRLQRTERLAEPDLIQSPETFAAHCAADRSLLHAATSWRSSCRSNAAQYSLYFPCFSCFSRLPIRWVKTAMPAR